jgi:nucleotide-binding universal stress UspA family protein
LIATDFSSGAQHALNRVVALPLDVDARVTLVHVRERSSSGDVDAALDRTAGSLRTAFGSGRTVAPIVAAGDSPFETIVRIADDVHAECVVCGRHGHRSFTAALLGSTAERVSRVSNGPVLVVGRAPSGPYASPLVGLELSAASPRVLAACSKVVPDGVAMVALHAYDVGVEAATSRGMVLADDEVRAAHREAAACASRSLETFLSAQGRAGASCTRVVKCGDPRTLLMNEAESRGADLVAVGTAFRSAVARLLLGPVAAEILRSAKADVLVVP